MIYRANYHLAREFIKYLYDVQQLNSASTGRYWSYLKHLLLWLDDVPFEKALSRRPTFTAYLAAARQDGRDAPMVPMTQKKILETAKRFFLWAKANHPAEVNVPATWIESLRLSRGTVQPSKEHAFVTLDEVRQLVALPVADGDLVTQRDQVGAALLFLRNAGECLRVAYAGMR